MSSERNWVLQVDSSVYKSLNRLSKQDARRIYVVIKSFSDNPFAGDIQKMKGEKSAWRRRIGAFRVFYEIISSEKIIHIFRVERRGSKTY